MLASMYMMYVVARATINPSLAPKPKEEDVPPWDYSVAITTPLSYLYLS